MDTVKVKLLDPRAKLPARATAGSVGWDLYAIEDVEVWSGECKVIRTGLALQLSPGFEAQVRPRSSLSKAGIHCSFGTVDTDYEGEVGVLLTNLNQQGRYEVIAGHRIAQLVFQQVPAVSLSRVGVDDGQHSFTYAWSERGAGGFGSTGK